MSNTVKIIVGVLIGLILIGICVIAAVLLLNPGDEIEPTAVATAAPEATQAPEETANAWERIQAAGKIVVGTSADYPPFEYYQDHLQIDGFDIALMDEIGRRLGLEIEYHDFAFDGLGGALQLGQIDLAIAAISVTPERESLLDFTNIYFVGQDAVLGHADSTFDISEPGDLSQYRVGAQRATVYEDWLQGSLVDEGLLPAANLFLYERADDAIRDLREDRLDLVMMDAQPAEVFASEEDLKVVGEGLNQQRYAIALPKGEAALRAELDQVLNDLHNEGFIADLSQEYLNVAQLLPTPTPAPTSTPAPPPSCIDGMAFVEHRAPEQGDPSTPVDMNPGQPFTKIWRVQNTGTCTWDSSYRVVFASGNVAAARMGGKPTAIEGEVAPGQTYDISVNLVAPAQAGVYYGYWEMRSGSQTGFGERLPFNVRVQGAPVATPVPTQTPVPGIVFTVDRDNITAGECVNFYWKVDNVKAVYFYRGGEPWENNGVVGEGNQKECPPATTTYYLRVVKNDDSLEVRQITVYVQANTEAPAITRFTVDPPNQITVGQCVNVQWRVEGQINQVTITANNQVLWANAPTQGNLQDCPSTTGNVAYGIQAVGPGGTSEGQHNVNVVDPATATPAPTAAPADPVIHSFYVQPLQIPAGGCVNIQWATGGGAVWVDVNRGEDTILDDGPLSGSIQDCPAETGTIVYGVSAFNAADKEVFQQIEVQVGP
jgi:ABC-type amino acid transport substrate-binding protein